MDILTAILAATLVIIGDFGYLRGTINGSVTPTKSTWIIFTFVIGFNAASLMSAQFDIGVLYSASDFFTCLLILTAVFWRSWREKIRFKKFEKYYLALAMICVIFWLWSSDAFTANLVAQFLLVVGYIPTIHNIVSAKQSSESKFSWTIWAFGSALSLYPAIINQNTLASIYALRAFVMCLVMIFLIYKFPNKGG